MYIIGSFLVLIGSIAFLDNLGILPGNFWEFFWPSFLIGMGILFIIRSRCGTCATCKKNQGGKHLGENRSE